MLNRLTSNACGALALLVILLSAPVAKAQRRADIGPELALRTGLALPFGEVDGSGGNNLDGYAGSAIPIGISGGVRIDQTLFFGARFQYAFPQMKNPAGSCENVSCDGSGVQVGLEGSYRFTPDAKFAPWVGLGGGYEWWRADYFTQNAGLGGTVRGFQGFVHGGGDVRVGPQLVVGPFAEVSFGRFDHSTGRVRVGNTTNETPSDIADTALHTWVTLGVRGAFGL
jgi:hypothetical protein